MKRKENNRPLGFRIQKKRRKENFDIHLYFGKQKETRKNTMKRYNNY